MIKLAKLLSYIASSVGVLFIILAVISKAYKTADSSVQQ